MGAVVGLQVIVLIITRVLFFLNMIMMKGVAIRSIDVLDRMDIPTMVNQAIPVLILDIDNSIGIRLLNHFTMIILLLLTFAGILTMLNALMVLMESRMHI